jgi:hypothetical protein
MEGSIVRSSKKAHFRTPALNAASKMVKSKSHLSVGKKNELRRIKVNTLEKDSI